jgi:hypothetical protein
MVESPNELVEIFFEVLRWVGVYYRVLLAGGISLAVFLLSSNNLHFVYTMGWFEMVGNRNLI